ncbi:DEAD/DEAH box RNA helicase [Trichodelitschia bisporula]|uniref:RNA helicase n=1 Tax=Trichodelitschia bisporula TaxID=703511 RepID=A0A6G1HN97_9PEZI|nr:DEAD/DEAH box RNA helicase [Trichodelitschia bisporula]
MARSEEASPVGALDVGETGEGTGPGKKWPTPRPHDYNALKGPTEVVEGASKGPAPEGAAAYKKYEWNDEYGDVGPRVPELEDELFGTEFRMQVGRHMETYDRFVTTEGPVKIVPVQKWEDAGLHPVIMDNIRMAGYAFPTVIQQFIMAAVNENKDVVAVSQTGSGKTAAYLIPILSRLCGKFKKLSARRPNLSAYNRTLNRARAEPLVLIVAPTRELVTQIFDETRRFCYRTMLRPCVVYGGGSTRIQREELEKGCDILVATPGRLMDFMSKPDLLSLKRVRYTILDEADEMLDQDWAEDLTKIMSGGDANEDDDHTYLFFSATFPKEMRRAARRVMEKEYYRISVGRIGSTHTNIHQDIKLVEHQDKREELYNLLFSMPPVRTLIFVNSKKQADLLDDYLFNKGLPSTSIHSERTQREREDALLAFRQGTCPILVTTGVAARGLDIKNVMHVINYDLPDTDKSATGGIHEYTHRIGRTARIGNQGRATSFYNERNADLAPALVKVLLENGQTVPEFLDEFRPEGDGKPDFESDHTDSDEQPEEFVPKKSGNVGGFSGGFDDDDFAPHAKTAATPATATAPAAAFDASEDW